jgi:hypothetical protein
MLKPHAGIRRGHGRAVVLGPLRCHRERPAADSKTQGLLLPLMLLLLLLSGLLPQRAASQQQPSWQHHS